MQFMHGSEQASQKKGGLSARERDVLFELRQGRSNKEIARNRTDIVIRAIDGGIA